jgi:hypothetical protein
MPFQRGQSGNPSGKRKDLPWREALMRAIKRKAAGDDAQALERVADAVVQAAIEGDMTAAKEIGDRLDGKPVQAVESSTEVTHYVIAIPAREQTSEQWASQQEPTIQ